MKNKKDKKKKKGWFSTFLIYVVLIAGLGLLLYPKVSDAWERYKISQEVAEYNQKLKTVVEDDATLNEYWAKADEYNRWIRTKDTPLIASQEERQWLKENLNPVGNGLVGTINIPAIDINLPVYLGTEEDALQSGAGWWIGSSYPVGGPSTHAIITAHTGLVKAELFTNLDKLKEGDVFSFNVLDHDLYYVIDQVLVTEPDDTAPLEVVEGEDYLTLYTCTPYGVNTHRLLVRGRRTEAPNIPVQTVIKGKLMNWWWLALLLIPFLLIPFFRRKKKKVVKDDEEPPAPWAPGMIRKTPFKRREDPKRNYSVQRKASGGGHTSDSSRASADKMKHIRHNHHR